MGPLERETVTECVMGWSNNGRDGGGWTGSILRTGSRRGSALLGNRGSLPLNPNLLPAWGGGLCWPVSRGGTVRPAELN